MIWPKPEEIKSDNFTTDNGNWSHETFRISKNIIHGRHRGYYPSYYTYDRFFYYGKIEGEFLQK